DGALAAKQRTQLSVVADFLAKTSRQRDRPAAGLQVPDVLAPIADARGVDGLTPQQSVYVANAVLVGEFGAQRAGAADQRPAVFQVLSFAVIFGWQPGQLQPHLAQGHVLDGLRGRAFLPPGEEAGGAGRLEKGAVAKAESRGGEMVLRQVELGGKPDVMGTVAAG